MSATDVLASDKCAQGHRLDRFMDCPLCRVERLRRDLDTLRSEVFATCSVSKRNSTYFCWTHDRAARLCLGDDPWADRDRLRDAIAPLAREVRGMVDGLEAGSAFDRALVLAWARLLVPVEELLGVKR